MDRRTRDRLFEPFFTTKASSKGTGLGLAIVGEIVRGYGGHVEVASELGRGTAVEVYLPRTEGAVPAEGPKVCPAPPARGPETIFVVEDEPAVRAVVRQVLRQHGYQVLEAGHGGEALEVAGRHRGPIDLLVTDVILPGISGGELAGHLTRRHPGLRVLYLSDYPDETLARHGVQARDVPFLSKPFLPATLAYKVREALEGKGG
jgi:CheY-like chemotaxis protein